MQQAGIIAIGTELTLGQTVDTNSAWLARQLARRGIRTTRHHTVADELPALVDVLRRAVDLHDLLIVTGGLGPTADDLTRAALAAAAADDLVEDADSLARIRAFFHRREREMPIRNAVQALRPRSARSLRNDWGTAPGLAIELGGTPVYCLPGVPREMHAMFAEHVAPSLPSNGVIHSTRLQCFGLGESELGDKIRDLMQRGRNPEVGTTADRTRVAVRINATAPTADQAARLLAETEAEVRERLGTVIYGRDDETLATAALDALRARGETLATAESCTGGLVGRLLTDVPGSSRTYLGGLITYADAAKQALLGVPADLLAEHGAVSEAVAKAMAVAARERFRSDWAVAISGIAGPDGGTDRKPVGLVYIGLAGPAGSHARRYLFGSDAERDVIRQRAAWTALNRVRLACLNGPNNIGTALGTGRDDGFRPGTDPGPSDGDS